MTRNISWWLDGLLKAKSNWFAGSVKSNHKLICENIAGILPTVSQIFATD